MKKLSMRNILIGFLVLLYSVLTIASAFALPQVAVTLTGDGANGKLYNDGTATCEYTVTGGEEPYNVHVELLNDDTPLGDPDDVPVNGGNYVGELVYDLVAGDASPSDVLTCEVTINSGTPVS